LLVKSSHRKPTQASKPGLILKPSQAKGLLA
jgi:hypothetical protein